MEGVIIILCAFGACLFSLLSCQIGYLIGKHQYTEKYEDKYWDMNRMISQYDDELSSKSRISVALSECVRIKNKDVFKDSVGDPYEDGGL